MNGKVTEPSFLGQPVLEQLPPFELRDSDKPKLLK
jgi:hypothetical protein